MTTTAIIKTARDQLEYEYLIKRCGEQRVAQAIASLPGARKPYLSNIAKAIGIEIPTDLQPAERSERGNAGLAAVREQLAKLKR